VSSTFLLQRRRDARLRRFGLVLGAVLAVAFHLVLFWGPRVDYRPVLEQARIRRVLVARPYQPAPAPRPVPPQPARRPAPKPPPTTVPKQAPKPAQPPKAVASPPPAPTADPQRRIAKVAEAAPDATRARAMGEDDLTREAAPLGRDAWAELLANLEDRKDDIQQEWQKRRDEITTETAKADSSQAPGGTPGTDEDGEGFLDSRIRMTVVSYPPTSIDGDHPVIDYPDLRFRRTQLQKGICRVYYRVWTDAQGAVVRTQLKTPSTKADRERYAAFVEQVEQSVAEWPFPRQESEIHIDVLFEIE
jgi:hypothetical protein